MDRAKHKILIVDDEEANLDLLARILRRKYDVRTATSGQEALDCLRKERFAAILSDQRMPGMKGTQFLAEARRLVPETVRMILTGYSAEQDSLDAINVARVNSFLTKPISPETVEHAIADAVEVFELGVHNQELIRQLEDKNRELAAAKRMLELSLDERTRELMDANRRLESLALRDPLTGLYNHRYFQERLAEEIARLHRYGTPLAVVLADIDHFRIYNEANGHDAGDKVIIRIAEILSGATRASDVVARLRPTDMVARYGGEEFAVVVPATAKAGAATMCERIQAAMAASVFPGVEALPNGRVTLSFGVVEAPRDGEAKQQLLEAVETALVRAKRGGRDRIELY